MEPEEILMLLKPIMHGLEHQIEKTPTGAKRNTLADANIYLMMAVDELDKIVEWDDEDGKDQKLKAV